MTYHGPYSLPSPQIFARHHLRVQAEYCYLSTGYSAIRMQSTSIFGEDCTRNTNSGNLKNFVPKFLLGSLFRLFRSSNCESLESLGNLLLMAEVLESSKTCHFQKNGFEKHTFRKKKAIGKRIGLEEHALSETVVKRKVHFLAAERLFGNKNSLSRCHSVLNVCKHNSLKVLF